MKSLSVSVGHRLTVDVGHSKNRLPFRTHDLFAVYKTSAGKKVFYRHAKYKCEESKAVSKVSVPIEVQASEDKLQAYERQVGKRGGGEFDPESFFAERDADGDGF